MEVGKRSLGSDLSVRESKNALKVQDSGGYCLGYDVEVRNRVATPVTAPRSVQSVIWTAVQAAISRK